MLTCRIRGGLGNQLFQIFSALHYAEENKMKPYFINSKISPSDVKRYTFWDSLLINIKHLAKYEKYLTSHKINQGGFTYKPVNIKNNKQNIILNGYFQSYKFFQPSYQKIYNTINIDKFKEDIIKKVNIENINECCSMHFRLGDYKTKPHFHPIMPFHYYKKSVQHIIDNTKVKRFIYFYEEEDKEQIMKIITRLSLMFDKCIFSAKPSDLKDWEEMILMSCCHSNIIANSSFSWWSAYFNSNKEKVITYPSLWFTTRTGINVKDMCPSEWKKIIV